MGHRAYPFEVGGPKRLTVSWDFFNSRYSIRLDDEDPVIVTGAEVREGRELTLSDGSTLLIRIADGNVASGLDVTRNGEPLPGSGADPATLVKAAAGTIYFLSGLHVVLGLFGLLGPEGRASVPLIMLGAVFAVLGFFTMKRSLVALLFAMGLYAAIGVWSTAVDAQAGTKINFFSIAIRLFFLVRMGSAFRTLLEKSDDSPGVSAP